MNRIAFRRLVLTIMLLAAGRAWSLGLGELRGQVVLGDGVAVSVDLLGVDRRLPDASCFRLVPPANASEIAWLKRAAFSVRPGNPPVLEIRSSSPLREPVLQIALQVACGHEVQREFVLLASPGREPVASTPEPRAAQRIASEPKVSPVERRRSGSSSGVAGSGGQSGGEESRLAPSAPRKAEKAPRRPVSAALPDRLLLSDGGGGEPSLRMATELGNGAEARDAQRDMLRLEFRMLMAMQEQATNQLETAEKLRKMEETLGELKQKASDFAVRVEQGGQPVSVSPAAPLSQVPAASAEEISWSLYAVLAGAVLGLAGWFGWRSRRERLAHELDVPLPVPPRKADPQQEDELAAPHLIDLAFEPHIGEVPVAVDVELDASSPAVAGDSVPQVRPLAPDSIMSINATSVDEHFEANPVMELADIMLSFGRVKGAAQALQEYIDNNPQEALQPWIRLMEVYRMAGMRQEFEEVALNLNRHFNVAVLPWEEPVVEAEGEGGGESESESESPRWGGLEDIPRLMSTVVDLWANGDVVGYLYQLLRDNRGGDRQGFTLPVVDDIMFLIELKETANRMVRAAE